MHNSLSFILNHEKYCISMWLHLLIREDLNVYLSNVFILTFHVNLTLNRVAYKYPILSLFHQVCSKPVSVLLLWFSIFFRIAKLFHSTPRQSCSDGYNRLCHQNQTTFLATKWRKVNFFLLLFRYTTLTSSYHFLTRSLIETTRLLPQSLSLLPWAQFILLNPILEDN